MQFCPCSSAVDQSVRDGASCSRQSVRCAACSGCCATVVPAWRHNTSVSGKAPAAVSHDICAPYGPGPCNLSPAGLQMTKLVCPVKCQLQLAALRRAICSVCCALQCRPDSCCERTCCAAAVPLPQFKCRCSVLLARELCFTFMCYHRNPKMFIYQARESIPGKSTSCTNPRA